MLNKCSLEDKQKEAQPNVSSMIILFTIQIVIILYFLVNNDSIFHLYSLSLVNIITLLYLVALFSFCIICIKCFSLYCTSVLIVEISVYFYIIYLIIQYYLLYHFSISFFIFDSNMIKQMGIRNIILLSFLLFSFINTSIDVIVTVFSIVHSFIPKQQIKKEKEEVHFDESQVCAICLNEMEDNEKFSSEDIVRLRCHPNHKFHLKCLTEWCKKNFACPICKTSII